MSNPNPIPRPPEPTANGEYNADGYDPDGYDRDGYNAMGFDVTGYDRTGFDASGQDINGYTSEQQQAYKAYYLVHSEYHPEQPILEADKNWGTVTETNNYLTSSNTVSQGPLCLGDFNLRWNEFNNFLPQACAYTGDQQQKLFLSAASLSVKTVTHLTKKNLEKLKKSNNIPTWMQRPRAHDDLFKKGHL